MFPCLENSNDLTRGLRTSARTIAATSGAVKEGAYYVKDNVYPAVKEKVVPAATSKCFPKHRFQASTNPSDPHHDSIFFVSPPSFCAGRHNEDGSEEESRYE